MGLAESNEGMRQDRLGGIRDRLAQELKTIVPAVDQDRTMIRLLEQLVRQLPEQAYEFVRSHLTAGFQEMPECTAILEALADEFLKLKALAKAEEVLGLYQGQTGRLHSGLVCRLAREYARGGNRGHAEALWRRVVAENPRNVESLRALYDAAKINGEEGQAHRYLNDLLRADPSPGTVLFAYRERSKFAGDVGKPVRIALLSTYVLDQLIPYLDWECRKVGLNPEFYVGPFNQCTQEVLNEGSGLHMFKPDVVFLALALEDLFPAISGIPTRVELDRAADEIRALLRGLIDELCRKSSALVVITEMVLLRPSPHGILDNRIESGVTEWIYGLNHALAEQMRTVDRAYLLPLDQVIRRVGLERGVNSKMQYMASMRLGEAVLPELAQYCMRYVKPLRSLTKKCIVLDLDGTLWGGIVGELGLEGIHLGPVAPGAEYVDFQRALLNLTRRGILLAICSKNNQEDVIPVLREHPYMVLREEHFGAMRINWKNKADNIRELSEELNIGLDSMVFIDDNPNERELVRQLLPEVLTVDVPTDPSRYRLTLEAMSDFELLAITKEDEMRVAQYQAMGKRQVLRSSATSIEEYLHSLALKVQISIAESDLLSRLVQMVNKTNQFNLTTKRYQAAEMEQFLSSLRHCVYVLRVADRFVDHGIVGLAIVEMQQDAWRIDTFLLSCRVMGLSVERALLGRICEQARGAGARTLRGEFIPTKKNRPAEPFYGQHGFLLDQEHAGCQYWKLPLDTVAVQCPSWIMLQGEGI